MGELVCLWCGNDGCKECTPTPNRIKIAFDQRRLAIQALEDIVYLFEGCSEEMKDQAVRGIVAATTAKITLREIKGVEEDGGAKKR